ncbi:hypothetical protein NN561_015296 [Cricetulus griseus]
MVSGGVGGPRPLGGSPRLLSVWAETRPANSLRKPARPRPRGEDPSPRPAARPFSPSGNAFLRAASAVPEGGGGGRKKEGGAGCRQRSPAAWPFLRGYGAPVADAPATRREGPAEAGVPGLTCLWAEGRGGWSGSVLQAALEPPDHPVGAASRSTLPAWKLLLLNSLLGRPSMKRKNLVFTDSFSLLWEENKKKKALKRSQPVSKSK